MGVRVRMFAALREAAGTEEVEVSAGALPVVLGGLRQRFGEPFASRLALCAVLLDGTSVPRDADVPVPDGAELALLPPVSGGAGRAEAANGPPGEVSGAAGGVQGIVAAALVIATFAALAAGSRVFAWLLVAAAGVVALDACVLLAGAGHRPVMPAALVTSVVLPLTVMFDPRSGPGRVPAWLAAGTLAAFGLVIVSPRRRGIGVALGVTLLAALLVGLGTSLLLGLRGLPDGFRWVLGFLLLTLVAELAGLLPATLARRRASRPPVGQRATAARAAAAASVAITALVLAVVLDPPFSPEAGGLLGVVAWTASLLAAGLGRMLSAKPAPAGGPAPAAAGGPAPAGPGSRPSALGGRGSRRTSGIDRGLGSGRLLRLAGAVLLGSPVAYLVVAHVLAPAAG